MNDVATNGNWYMYFLKYSFILLVLLFGFKSVGKDSRLLVLTGITVCGYILSVLDYITNTQVGRIGYFFSCFVIIVGSYISQNGLIIGKIKIKQLKKPKVMQHRRVKIIK